MDTETLNDSCRPRAGRSRQVALAMALVAFVAGYGLATWRAGLRRADSSPFSAAATRLLALQGEERPSDYLPLREPSLLHQLGMTANPDYITNPTAMEPVAHRGGVLSFAAVYGHRGENRLILNGIFFRERHWLDEFAAFQKAKAHRVRAYAYRIPDGYWLLLLGRDPELAYTDAELHALTEGLQRYQQRLHLIPIFAEPAGGSCK